MEFLGILEYMLVQLLEILIGGLEFSVVCSHGNNTCPVVRGVVTILSHKVHLNRDLVSYIQEAFSNLYTDPYTKLSSR